MLELCLVPLFRPRELLEGLIGYTSLSVGWSAAMALPGRPNLRGWPIAPPARAKSVPKPQLSHSPYHPRPDSQRPKSFKCQPDFERHCSSEEKQAFAGADILSGKPMYHFLQGVGECLCITPGVTWRLQPQVWEHSRPKWLCECGEAASIFLPRISYITLKMW